MENLQDVVNEVRQLQDALERCGELRAALTLCKAVGGYYTTSSEALMGVLDALRETSRDWMRVLEPQEVRRAQQIVQAATKLLNLR